jgi:hypothetical protein
MALEPRHALGWVVVAVAAAFASPSFAMPSKSWFSFGWHRAAVAVALSDKDCFGKDGEKVYASCLSKEQNTVTLKGFVPSDADLKLLQGVLAAASPGMTLVDRSDVNDAVPNRDTWLAGMTFALRHLVRLEKGNAALRGSAIYLDGTTRPDDDVRAVNERIVNEVPKGLVLQQAGIQPAWARPFIWNAQVTNGALRLSGHVPQEARNALTYAAQEHYAASQIEDAMTPARGAPDGWLGAAKLALEMLRYMQQGRITLVDRVITLEGALQTPETAKLVKNYSDKMPKGFRIEAKGLEAKSPA